MLRRMEFGVRDGVRQVSDGRKLKFVGGTQKFLKAGVPSMIDVLLAGSWKGIINPSPRKIAPCLEQAAPSEASACPSGSICAHQ
jgi:hypothetical protein